MGLRAVLHHADPAGAGQRRQRPADGLVGHAEVAGEVEAGEEVVVIESVKAASDVYSPVTGTVTAVNTALSDKPETINEDAYGEGWIFAG